MFLVLVAVALAVGVSGRERYLLYTVNGSEGFNLARDVYIRVVALLDKLRAESADTWSLVGSARLLS